MYYCVMLHLFPVRGKTITLLLNYRKLPSTIDTIDSKMAFSCSSGPKDFFVCCACPGQMQVTNVVGNICVLSAPFGRKMMYVNALDRMQQTGWHSLEVKLRYLMKAHVVFNP